MNNDRQQTEMKFIGIDLGWVSGSSGLCCLQWHNEQLQILDLTRRQPLEEIFAWLDAWVGGSEAAMVAVDAPTLIPNATGMRLCDRLTHKYFGSYHAGSYPANLSRPFASRTVKFGCCLERRGFVHAPTIVPQQPGRYQIEVFPHPATIHLFGLKRIIKFDTLPHLSHPAWRGVFEKGDSHTSQCRVSASQILS